MACKGCEERRRLLEEAIKKEGAKGFAKAVPKVAAHTVRDVRARLRPRPRTVK